MASLSRLKEWIAEVLTFGELNAEFDNIINNQQDLSWPRDGTVASDFDGNELILDADGDTSIRSDTDDQLDLKIGGSDVYRITRTALNGPPMRKNLANISAMQAKVADIERRVLNVEHTALFETRIFS